MTDELKPVAWMWQHDETGMVGFVQHATVKELRHWERMNRPRKIVTPLYASPVAATALQQERIKALEEDAARYRWLRGADDRDWNVFMRDGDEQLDAAVDAARGVATTRKWKPLVDDEYRAWCAADLRRSLGRPPEPGDAELLGEQE